MSLAITDWLEGRERNPAPSTHFATIDATEMVPHTDELVDDLSRRVIAAKSSRAYLEKYVGRLSWDFLSQRLAAGPAKLRRGDWGEVVAMAWIEDFSGFIVPVKKLRLQMTPGQSLPGTDAVALEVDQGQVVRCHFLESKLRTTNAFLTTVGLEAYRQLEAESQDGFLEILQFVHEWMHNLGHELVEPLTKHLEGRETIEDDGHDVVLLVDSGVWDDEVLVELDSQAGSLPLCTVHVLQCADMAALVDETFRRIGVEVISMDEE